MLNVEVIAGKLLTLVAENLASNDQTAATVTARHIVP